jgi:nucleotide-binding universal stress UspA family protein
MAWKPIVAGVDGSAESARAAAFAADLAQAAGTSCQLVHVTRDEWSALAIAEMPGRAQEFRKTLMAQARERLQHTLWGIVPPDAIQKMMVLPGRTPDALKQVATECDAGLVVLGGKHHAAVARWFAGSTGLDVVRTTDVPVLVVGDRTGPIRRVLAAVDLSAAARPTIEAAERVAELLGAELRVLCAIEPLPIIPEAPNFDLANHYAVTEDQIAQEVWPLLQASKAEKVIRYGTAVETLLQEVADWDADLVVVGSHGKGWVDRLLVGSVTERLLNRLPTSLLVVPVYAVVAAQDDPGRTDRRPWDFTYTVGVSDRFENAARHSTPIDDE